MKRNVITATKQASLELTRHENFIDGRVDMFDLLASKKTIMVDGERLSIEK